MTQEEFCEKYGDRRCDWYEIVNLREWTER